MTEQDETRLQRLGVGVVVGTGLGVVFMPLLGPASLAIGAGVGTAVGAAVADLATRNPDTRARSTTDAD